MKIARESWIIATIGLADLVTTIVFIRHHGAQEANPVFRRFWEMGLIAFILAKLACLIGPLYVLEWARTRSTQFVKVASRAVILAYLVMYGIGVAHLNGPSAQANEIHRMPVRSAYTLASMRQMFMLQYEMEHQRLMVTKGHLNAAQMRRMQRLDEEYRRPPPIARYTHYTGVNNY
jgi:hypothetical protein